MNAPFRQAERLGRLSTSLGPGALALLRFDGTDHLNDLFEYRVEALSTRDDLDFDALVGTHATVEIEAHDEMRAFDGIVTSARWAGVGENGHRYDLTLRPWFWLAGKRRNQRIFHDKTVIEILQELLAGHAHNSAYQIAGVFAWGGEHDTAFDWLQRAVSQRDAGLQYLKYDPALHSLRSDPRYLRLLQQLDLPT